MTLRRLLFWLHLSVGLAASLLLVFLATTGAIISFAPQIIAAAEHSTLVDHSVRVDHTAASACVPPSTLLSNAAAASGQPLSSLTLFTDPHRPAQVATGPAGAVLLADACTGRILGPGANRLRTFFSAVTELHHQAAFRGVRYETLRTLKNAAALCFVFLTLSGLWVWFPRQLTWQRLRASLLFRNRLHGRAREWNLHTVAGFWLCIPLFLMATTGVIMAYPWANALLYRAAGEAPPPPRKEAPRAEGSRAEARRVTGAPEAHHRPAPSAPNFTALDAPIARALTFTPGIGSVSLRLPTGEAKTLTFQLSRVDRQPVLRDQLTLSSADAQVLKWEPLANATRGRRWRVGARFLHTGELLGTPGQAIVLLAALGALLLVWTGISLSLRRLAAFRRRRTQTHPTSATAEQPVQVS